MSLLVYFTTVYFNHIRRHSQKVSRNVIARETLFFNAIPTSATLNIARKKIKLGHCKPWSKQSLEVGSADGILFAMIKCRHNMQGFKPNQMLFKHDCVSVIVMHKFCTLCVCDLCRETVSPKATLMGYSVWLFRPFTKPRIAEFEAIYFIFVKR